MISNNTINNNNTRNLYQQNETTGRRALRQRNRGELSLDADWPAMMTIAIVDVCMSARSMFVMPLSMFRDTAEWPVLMALHVEGKSPMIEATTMMLNMW